MKSKLVWIQHDTCADITPWFGLVRVPEDGIQDRVVPAHVVPDYLSAEEAAGMVGISDAGLEEGQWYDVRVKDGYVVAATRALPPPYVVGTHIVEAVVTDGRRPYGGGLEVRFSSPHVCDDSIWLRVPSEDTMREVPLYSLVELEWHRELDGGDYPLDTFVAIRNVRPPTWGAPIPPSQPKSEPTTNA
jgi:hypothetical protein